jgi:hypothetical protein
LRALGRGKEISPVRLGYALSSEERERASASDLRALPRIPALAFVHQIGPNQDDFLRFYADEVRPRLEAATDRRAAA